MWIAGNERPELSARIFHKLQVSAERGHDPRTLAFLAMRSRDEQTSRRLADQAIALDPSLTWILSEVPFSTSPARFEQLERWDPDNAVPYLLHADYLERSAQVAEKKDQNTILSEMLAGKPEFVELVNRGFAAPHYDSYLGSRLALDREVMRKYDIAEPMLLLAGVQWHHFPAAGNYAEWIIAAAKMTSSSADLRPLVEARQRVVRFGQRMESQSLSPLERESGVSLQLRAGKDLVPMLREQGKIEEAETLAYSLHHLNQSLQRDMVLEAALLDPHMTPMYRANPFNPGVIIHIGSLVFSLALALLAASVFYLRLRQTQGGTVVALPRMISYAPVLLFTAALTLLVTYMPYARIFRMYMVGQEMARAGHTAPWLAGPINDPQLLSTLANLQYPYAFLSGTEVWRIVWITFCIAFAAAIYSLWRMRISTAKT
jgi:hypothetical protein